MRVTSLFGQLCVVLSSVNAFQPNIGIPFTRHTTALWDATPGDYYDNGSDQVEALLKENYPEFSSLLSMNEAVWKALREATDGYTIFAPNSKAFEGLGEKKRNQLRDPRNGEVAEKIGSYHAIAEPVTAQQLFEAGGVITIGGEIPTFLIGGGMFGFLGGDKENSEQTVTINGAKVLQTINIGSCIVHEVDALVSPRVLWRYADQLRIPGSK